MKFDMFLETMTFVLPSGPCTQRCHAAISSLSGNGNVSFREKNNLCWFPVGTSISTVVCCELRSFWKLELEFAVANLSRWVCLSDLNLNGGVLRFQVILEIGTRMCTRSIVLLVCLRDLKLDDGFLRYHVSLEMDMSFLMRAFVFLFCFGNLKLNDDLLRFKVMQESN